MLADVRQIPCTLFVKLFFIASILIYNKSSGATRLRNGGRGRQLSLRTGLAWLMMSRRLKVCLGSGLVVVLPYHRQKVAS